MHWLKFNSRRLAPRPPPPKGVMSGVSRSEISARKTCNQGGAGRAHVSSPSKHRDTIAGIRIRFQAPKISASATLKPGKSSGLSSAWESSRTSMWPPGL
jgi:hypothetical protein